MKKLIGINLILGFFLAQSALADLVVNQSLTTKYYSGAVIESQMPSVENILNREVRKYNCLQDNFKNEITKTMKSKIFGHDIPGDVKISYQTKCFNSDILGINFSVDAFGYDEDYTTVIVKITTKKGVSMKQFCVYGLDGERKCPNSKIDSKAVFSTQGEMVLD